MNREHRKVEMENFIGRMTSFNVHPLGVLEEYMGKRQVLKKECLRMFHNCWRHKFLNSGIINPKQNKSL